MTSPCGKIRIPINESSDDKSQIQEYLSAYHGEGIQHIALGTGDIYESVEALQAQGRAVPGRARHLLRAGRHAPAGPWREPRSACRADRILIDGAPTKGGGLLLQIFTQTVIGPIFFEIIQRQGNEGFGEGNFRALFESIELDQIRRGVLKAKKSQRRKPWPRTGFRCASLKARRRGRPMSALPEGTYEREISKEGFFGPSAQFHHKHKPTDWVEFDGAIRPRAFDLNKLVHRPRPSPWRPELVMNNPHLQMRIWKLDKPMTELARNSDGDQLLFIHEGEGELFCDYGHLDYRDGDYLVIPRGTMWRLSPAKRRRWR